MNISYLIEKFSQYVTPQRLAKIKTLVAQRTRAVTVVLEDVYQSHNTGAILRSCEAFGIQDVHYLAGRNQLHVNNAIASGASRWLTVHSYTSQEHCVTALKKEGYLLVGTSPHATHRLEDLLDAVGRSSPSHIASKDEGGAKNIALFFGTEQEGLSRSMMEAMDLTVAIPLSGFTESLNVSVSVGICLYALMTDLKKNRNDWQLSADDQQALILAWLKQSVERPDLLESEFLR